MKFLIIIFFVAFSETVLCQPRNTITWSSNRNLKWSDFKGPVDSNSNATAISHINEWYGATRTVRNGVIIFTFETKSLFFPSLSWVRRERQSDAILEHEQLHFDISAIHARALLNALYKGNYSNNYKNEVRQIAMAHKAKRDYMEALYDKQTSHSQNRDMQLKWYNFVNELKAGNIKTDVPLPTWAHPGN